jgi:hypothetical protein
MTAGALLFAAALAVTGYEPVQAGGAGKGRKPAASTDAGKLITVLSPAIASKMAERVPLAPRLDTLDGKTIYMMDINWGGPEAAYSVFEEIQAWLAANKPGVKTVIRRMKGSYMSEDAELLKEISKNANAAIVGISG